MLQSPSPPPPSPALALLPLLAFGGFLGCTLIADYDPSKICDAATANPLPPQACGVGACNVLQELGNACTPVACQPGAPENDDVCGDGIDNDCDGLVDEGCACEDGREQNCFTGSPLTRRVGACHDGKQLCQSGVWGACTDAVLPVAEACDDGIDNDCDGEVDEGCSCSPGQQQPCYGGAPATVGIGLCKLGFQTCTSNGAWGECETDVVPQLELPDGMDNDCNGIIDDGAGCPPGETRPCYSGPAGTEGVGPCKVGTQSCIKGHWSGTCTGEVLPKAEVCNLIDDDCNSITDDGFLHEGEECIPNLLGECSKGKGVYVCLIDGLVCQPTIAPQPETCDGLDNDCDGVVDDGNFCCPDGTKNGNEPDIDCGGSCMQKCAAGKKCNLAADCISNSCIGSICQP